MNEIRLRLWNDVLKKMSPIMSLGEATRDVCRAIKKYDAPANAFDNVYKMAMLSTLQLDSNDKEMCVKDIIESYVEGHHIVGIMGYNPKTMTFGIQARAGWIKRSNFEVDTKKHGRPTIIGNAFENPHLMLLL